MILTRCPYGVSLTMITHARCIRLKFSLLEKAWDWSFFDFLVDSTFLDSRSSHQQNGKFYTVEFDLKGKPGKDLY